MLEGMKSAQAKKLHVDGVKAIWQYLMPSDTYHDGFQASIAAGVWGSPTFVVDGEIFWGVGELTSF